MKQLKFNIISALLLVAAMAFGTNAWAMTKTVTYTITSVESVNLNYTIVFTRSGDTPFDTSAPNTFTATVNGGYFGQTTGGQGSFSVDLSDGFSLDFSWGAGSNVSFNSNCIHPDSHNGKTITYGIWSHDNNYYVTHFELTGFEGTWMHPNIPVDQQWHFNRSITTGYSLGSVSVTYTDVPALSIFESDGENAYKIKSKVDLRHLANYVNNGNNDCNGLTFRQTQDITCDNTYTPIGDDDHYFRGTYDGQGHTVSGITVTPTGSSYNDCCIGLFGQVKGGTVQNVTLSNSSFTGKNNVGGIVGYNVGSTIENCRVESSVTIHAGYDNAEYLGGIAGGNRSFMSGNVKIEGKIIGCVSAATVSKNSKSGCSKCGGIVGQNDEATVENCLYTGTTVSSDSYVGAIAGQNHNGTLTNNYYTGIDLGGVNSSDQDGARRAYTVTLGENIVLVGDETTYSLSGITAIGTTALRYNNTLYSGATQTLTLNYTGLADGYTAFYSVNGSPIDGNTFQMPANDVTVSAEIYKSDYITYWQAGPLHDGSSDTKPYLITTPAGLQLLASEVNGGNNFAGKYFQLGCDIDMSSVDNFTPIGNTSAKYFSGNFNGADHTIRHLTITQTGKALVGLFGYLSGDNPYPVVSNLTLDGANISAGDYVGGIVGHQLNCSVSNCHVVSSSISGTATGAKVGAIAGKFSNISNNSLSNCTYHSTLVYANSNQGNAFNIGCGLKGLSNNGGDSNGAGLDATQLFVDGGRTDLATLLAAYNAPASYTAHNGTAPDLSGLTATVRGHVTIPSGSVLEAPTINIATGGSLTLADGAELICNNPVQNVTVQKEIAAYTNNQNGWNLFAMPFNAGLNPTLIDNLIPSDPTTVYDLYRLKETTTCWENYKQHESDFCIRPILGDGACLYATSVGTTLQKDGQIYPNTVEGDTAYLNKQGEGWNLIANPYTFKAYVNKPFLRMNAEGSALVPVANYWETPLNVCEGIVVKADSIFEPVIFTHTAPQAPASSGGKGSLNIALSQANTRSNTAMDKAIVSFNDGIQLGKFYFGEQDANIYIPQNGKEYAIVSVGNVGEIPVNFKAKKNGEYTLTVTISDPVIASEATKQPEGSSTEGRKSIHLIDNIAGIDVDLLQTPSYTFTARYDDYASRFRLVFSANENNNDNEAEDFAFISNGEIVVNGTGTVQVIDMLGRQLFSKEKTSDFRLPTSDFSSGVYVLRIINGDKVRTQKIVIR